MSVRSSGQIQIHREDVKWFHEELLSDAPVGTFTPPIFWFLSFHQMLLKLQSPSSSSRSLKIPSRSTRHSC